MTKTQVTAWARSMVTLQDANRTRVVVKGVKVCGMPAKVRFTHNRAKHTYVARCHGYPPIRVRFDEEHGNFIAEANNHQVVCHANTADRAFAHAVNKAWDA